MRFLNISFSYTQYICTFRRFRMRTSCEKIMKKLKNALIIICPIDLSFIEINKNML